MIELKKTIQNISDSALAKPKPDNAEIVILFNKLIDLECAAFRIVLMGLLVSNQSMDYWMTCFQNAGIDLHSIERIIDKTKCMYGLCRKSKINSIDNWPDISFIGSQEIELRSKMRISSKQIWRKGIIKQIVSSYSELENYEGIVNRIRHIENSHKRIRNKIIELHQFTVLRSLRSHSEHWQHIEDMYQEGLIGVIDSVERFDVNKSHQFEAYASNTAFWYIHRSKEIIRHVHLPAHYENEIKKLSRWMENNKRYLLGDYENIDTSDIGLSLNIYDIYGAIASQPESLEQILEENPDEIKIALIQLFHDINEPQVDSKALKAIIYMASNKFRKRDRNIFLRYYVNQNVTLDEIGRDFSLTRERVRQVIENILSKIKRNTHNSCDYIIELQAPMLRYREFEPRWSYDFLYNELDFDNKYSPESIYIKTYIKSRLKSFNSKKVQTREQKNVNFINPAILAFLEGT